MTVTSQPISRLFGDLDRALDPSALSWRLAARTFRVILAGTLAYGFVFGVWRDPWQGLYSAVKLPGVFFAVVLASGFLNTVFAQLLGARLSFRQTAMAMLLALASSAALLGSLAPVVLFFIYQAPPPDPTAADAMKPFWIILLTHIAIIGFTGFIGYARLYRMLKSAIGDRALARRVLLVWTAVSGFVGCEISWLFSPFLCKPNYEPHFIAQEYRQGNFYQQVGKGLWELIIK